LPAECCEITERDEEAKQAPGTFLNTRMPSRISVRGRLEGGAEQSDLMTRGGDAGEDLVHVDLAPPPRGFLMSCQLKRRIFMARRAAKKSGRPGGKTYFAFAVSVDAVSFSFCS